MLASCTETPRKPISRTSDKQADSLAFFTYLDAGDSVYAAKKGYASFAASLKYYDSAQAIADRSGDSLLLAEAIFAKGRVHDAWNKEPRKTIAYFKQAASLFRPLPVAYKRYLYAKHLLAHAYDKIQDSTHTARVLAELYAELKTKDTALLRSIPSTAEMALIATEVRAYPLADSILTHLSRRQWIRNDPNTYDYLDHYYLTRSRLEVFWRKNPRSAYVDSLEIGFQRSKNVIDSLYYSTNLANLYAAGGRFKQAYTYLMLAQVLGQRLNQHKSIAEMQQALLRSELRAEKRKLEYRASIRETRLVALWIMGALLAVITGLSIYLYYRNKSYRAQSQHLSVLNGQLDDKVEQVELLNKEIQHRIKNNLQVIYSLLRMQERKSQQVETIESLQIARLRIESIANLHNQLAASNDELSIASFSENLIPAVVACFSVDRQVITHVNAIDRRLSSRQYLPLALMLTEWVINSLKHASPASGILEINVTFSEIDKQICLRYCDNGQSSQTGARSGDGLGTEIINLLSRQLDAVLTTPGLNPYHYVLSFSNDG
ncbi:sensor histidine kinase [Spirosoma sp. KUDC1026]|uniref:sensor histidine kinase n=1 Tax=Spirosoma sp. KUDC1026 TaxID=2745947 RepID=UPI00159BBA10|nr:sensor histidine kinase [Spirosoma sp. KUDC1026]QKZ12932.1 sensor histidine kinase [Spirosoma sp. KUDC1026]